ncbi:Uma2 family endonuclease [Actinomadura sp. HBU206391]|uniref:Uma2 family endonuclease n=1 Tax=Actinomadura sp. HBU206391 TaxID=2731692 RepID=UPI00164F4AD3|nr:Uma2 family endonuclease [Actinomadura sp. HBU206391]MBC6456772.1 Uma2 family endonuclease [Actinomadura sp. HBU206391]
MTALPEWMSTLPEEGVTAEEYDRMPQEVCRRIEIVDGSIIVYPSATPRHNRIARLLANALEEAAPSPWQVTTDVDLRLADVPLHNRRPDIVVFRGDPDHLPIRPPQVLLAAEIMSRVSVSADRIDKPAEYAIAGLPHYWRIEQEESTLIAYTYALDPTGRSYESAGVHSVVLKMDDPFPVTVDLDALL